MSTAEPIEDYIWCLVCGDTHTYHEGKLMFTGICLQDVTCQEPVGVNVDRSLWDEATQNAYYSDNGKGYDLYEMSPDADPTIHRPMYYLEGP